jgi:F-type H+-transporting ATPase subunit b
MEFLHEPTNWVFLSFVIFAVLFARYGWKNVAAKLDGRIDEIRSELKSAETLRNEAQAMLAEYQAKHRDAMKEAQDIAVRARQQAKAIQEKAEADIAETMVRREKQLEERLNRIEAAAEAELRRATAELAIKAAEAQIRKSLDGDALIDKSIAALPGNLN